MAIVAPQGMYLEALNYVLWDVENCCIPCRCDPATVPGKIMTWLRNLGYRGDITIVAVAANADRVHPDVCKLLRDNHVEVIVLDSIEKQVSDDHIKELIKAWTSANRPPANITLIFGDGGFVRVLRSLEQRRYNVILAYIVGSASSRLRSIETAHGDWRLLL